MMILRRQVRKFLLKSKKGESSSNERNTYGENGEKSSMNIWKCIQRRELGLGPHSSTGFSEHEKSRVFSKYLPNTVTEVIKHHAKVFSGHYSQDGSVFMSASQDCHIKLYETGRGHLREFQDVVALNVGWSVVDTAYSHDQRHLIYSSWSPNLYLCDIAGGCEKGQVALDMRPAGPSFCAFSIKFSQDDREILTGSNEGGLYIYDRGCEKRTLRINGHSDDVNAVCFCDNTSQLLFSAADDGLCKVWDRRTLNEHRPEPVGVFAGHVCGLGGVDSKGDGRYLITSSKDQTIKLWDMRRFTDADGMREGVMAVAKNQYWDYRWEGVPKRFQRDTKLKGDVSVMTYRGHSFLRCLIRARFSPVETTAQNFIYTGSADGCIYIYDLNSGMIVSRLQGHNDVIRDVSWHPSRPCMMSSSWDQTVKCWEYSRDKEETERSDKEIAEDERDERARKRYPSQKYFFRN
ncbi:DDB1- and CUL4-associated factor 11-like isoform X2 [Dendronephthya gigantea]|uniref:DDB1- and CUL4-associated factor 11-like isoform X2 n=1 Tax=Dendronephthya gigantea TaxID=151771 RepID=UPI00106B7430|nr:DDB1- and CUL4-associated factor 11-like isoform X2 [Dendronephthya gigantea]